jgi:hypothetical protein
MRAARQVTAALARRTGTRRSASFATMPRDMCIFCERARPLVKMTREHLFSRWVDDVLTPQVLGPDRSYERTTAAGDSTAKTTTWPSEVIAAIEAAVVCGGQPDGCNNGWMGGLDGQVRHLLEPMMLGRPRTLTCQEQATIAAWAAMKSMVLEYLWGPEQVIVLSQTARTLVFRRQQAPGDMQIRIAAVESRGRPALAVRRVYQLQPNETGGDRRTAFASCSTLVLGCFAVQTYATSAPGSSGPPQPHGPSYLVLNPPAGGDVSWPPPDVLDDKGLDRFAHPLQPLAGG